MSDNEVATEYKMEVFSDSATMNGLTVKKTEDRIGLFLFEK